MRGFKFLLFLFFSLACTLSGFGQVRNADGSVLDPNDPIVEYGTGHFYNADNPPPKPQDGYIGKWVRTKRMNWNTDSYKAYFYKGLRFRIKFPKGYDPKRAEKYPAIVMLHGKGEVGDLFDNEKQLTHGGKIHSDAVDLGKWDGFVIFPQTFGGWPEGELDAIKELVEFMALHRNVDINRINLHGLSMGGGGTWAFVLRHPKFMASALPMSGTAADQEISQADKFKFTPVWISQGGLDTNPTAGVTNYAVDQLLGKGANLRYSLYENLGHGVWNTHYNEKDFFPFMARANKANPWPLYGRTEFCPNDPINVTLGVTAGFDGYEWRKNGAIIAGANSHTLTVTSLGIYDVRIKRGSEWSYWSPQPVEIKLKPATITPPIQLAGLASTYIPAPSNQAVTLEMPAGYEAYVWKKVGSEAIIGTERTLLVTAPGEYIASVTEQYGCSSNFSQPFRVYSSGGTNTPEPIIGLNGTAPSKTEVQLNWSDNPNALHNETGFEIYRSTKAGGPYSYVAVAGQDVKAYKDGGLLPGVEYYYIVRPVNANGAAAVSAEIKVKTQVDSNPPLAPLNLKLLSTTNNHVKLGWDAATDDVGVSRYEVFRDGSKILVVSGTSADIYNLQPQQVYNFTVKAVDFAGNISPASNQVTALTVIAGLNYAEYHGNWNVLPDFDALTPVNTGVTDNFNIGLRSRSDYFAFKFDGLIKIPTAGNYTFYTTSDDGSKLYINDKEIVNNDGLHGAQERQGTIYLAAGTHAIKVTFFEQGGGERLEVRWQGPGISKQLIPTAVLKDDFTMPGTTPAFPTGLLATAAAYNQINLSWKDNSTNETGFQLYRATSALGPYYPIAVVGNNLTTYEDKGLAASTTYYYKVLALGKYGDSGFSNEIKKGLRYKYYESSFSSVSQLDKANPKKTGQVANFDLALRDRNSSFAFVWEGDVFLPEAGEYTFYTESDDGSKLWIKGTEVVNNDYNQGMTERSGTYVVTTPGIHAIKVAFRQGSGGYGLNVRYKGPNIAKQVIPDVALMHPEVNAKTLPLPAVPVTPSDFNAIALSTTEIKLSFTDRSTTEDKFEVFYSVGDNTAYQLLTSVNQQSGAGQVLTYNHTALFPNVNYYYKVRAVGPGGASAYSPEVTVKTLNNFPVLESLPGSLSLRYDESQTLNLLASDVDGDALSYTIREAASLNIDFISVTDNGDGSGKMLIQPVDVSDIGTYQLEIVVTDSNGGSDVKLVALNVNGNFSPVLAAIGDQAVKEAESLVVPLSATDQNADDVLTFSLKEEHKFLSIKNQSGNSAELHISPTYAHAGIYQVKVLVADPNQGVGEQIFTLTVEDVETEYTVSVNFGKLKSAPAPWNNLLKAPVIGDQFTGLKDGKGIASSVNLTFLTNWGGTQFSDGGWYNEGAITWNNSGVYPDNVIEEYYYMGFGGGPDVVEVKVGGLKANFSYDFTFFGSSKWSGTPDNGETNYTINGRTVALHVQNNTSKTVTIDAVQPNENGEVVFQVSKGAGATVGYLNALVVRGYLNDGLVPSAPENLQATLTQENHVSLTWVDNSYSETKFEVYRSTTPDANFVKVGETGVDNSTFIDTSVLGSTTYYYKGLAVNANGSSVFSNTASIQTLNGAPVINRIANATVVVGNPATVQVNATDPEGETITLALVNPPSFVSLTGNTITINPTVSHVGAHQINVSATDGDNTTLAGFEVKVSAVAVTSTYINFSRYNDAPAPWNSTAKEPAINDQFSNLIDENGNNTGFSVRLTTDWGGAFNDGATSSNDSGIYPNSVMKEYYFFGYWKGPEQVPLEIGGLDNSKLYNFKFFASSIWAGDADNGETNFTIGGTTVALNVQGNTTNEVKINGVSPVNGVVTVTLSKGSSATVGYLNALVIEEYENQNTLFAPTALKTSPLTSSSIKLAWADNSSNEEGFEIYRASYPDGTYQLLTTVNANTTSYTNEGLSEGAAFKYKVRSINNNGATKSEFSNASNSSTFVFTSFINFNEGDNAPAPWNNTNAFPSAGVTLEDLKTSKSISTGITLTLVDSWTGHYPGGATTGNNSGIYPDVVMKTYYYAEAGSKATIKFSNLQLDNLYSFSFFGSWVINVGSTKYTVNNQVAKLAPYNNTTNKVTVSDLAPDGNGEIWITIEPDQNVEYGFLGAMEVSAYKNLTPTTVLVASSSASARASDEVATTTPSIVTEEIMDAVLGVYPNPFGKTLHFDYKVSGQAKMNIKVLDLLGRHVMSKEVVLEPEMNSISLDLGEVLVKPGVYILMTSFDDKTFKTYRLIRE